MALAVLVLLTACGSDEEDVVLEEGQAPASTQASDCEIEQGQTQTMGLPAHTFGTLAELGSAADAVAHLRVGEVRSIPDASSGDEDTFRTVATTSVLSGSRNLPGEIDLFFALTAAAPGRDERLVVGPDLTTFVEGDELVIGLTGPRRSGEWTLTTTDAFFPVEQGRVDPAFSDLRRRCTDGELKTAFAEAEGLTVTELIEAIGPPVPAASTEGADVSEPATASSGGSAPSSTGG